MKSMKGIFLALLVIVAVLFVAVESRRGSKPRKGTCSAVQLSIKPSGNTFLTGTDLKLRCKCYMNPSGTYAFIKDGVPVTTDSRVTLDRNKLFINNANGRDSGTYSCSATTRDGNTKSPTNDLSITVFVPPTITIAPDNQTVKEDEPVYLHCKEVSSPAAKISWTKDNNPVRDDVTGYTLFPNGTFFIAKAKPSDSGTYKCSAGRPGSWTVDADAKLVVMALRIVNYHVHVVNAYLHRPQRIACNFEGHQPIKVTWKKDGGVQVRSTDRIKVENSVVHFKTVEKEDQGRYWCLGENSFSSATSYVNLSVYVYPTFDLRPKDTTAFVDDHIWLHCNASGDPKPKISWSKDVPGGDRLDKDRFIQYPNGTLYIKEVRMEDRGRYHCIAANDAEMMQSKFSLDVQSRDEWAPSIVTYGEKKKGKKGGNKKPKKQGWKRRPKTPLP